MRPWGLSVGPGRLHYSQSVCRDCGLVFSNPVCDWGELEEFYRDDYWQSHWPEALDRDGDAVRRSVDDQRAEVKRVQAVFPKGRLLEIGAGTGSFLAAARDAGYDVWGVETSAAAVLHAQEVFGLTNVVQDSVPTERFEPASFDVVYAWHVIEHVVDLDAFIGALRALLKPGGLLWIGTESYRNSSHYLERAASRIRGLPPPFSTATEHTFVFNEDTLTDVVRRRGFDVVLCETYQPSLAEKLKTMRFRSPLGRLYFLMQHGLNSIASKGPLLRLAARKT
ncbi:MAG: class I SAM-dependent methyltransferase [Gemmatimonadales bacterium]